MIQSPIRYIPKTLNLAEENDKGYEIVDEAQRRELEKEAEEFAPPNWQVMKDILGITPLTIAGFALAGILLTLNSILGPGWIADLLGMSSQEQPRTYTNSLTKPTEENQFEGFDINLEDIMKRINEDRKANGIPETL
jgi:hypothetical protein